jgi:hypothetical protein
MIIPESVTAALDTDGLTVPKTLNTVDKDMLTDQEIKDSGLRLVSQTLLGYQDDLRVIQETYVSPKGIEYWRVIYTY